MNPYRMKADPSRKGWYLIQKRMGAQWWTVDEIRGQRDAARYLDIRNAAPLPAITAPRAIR